MHHSAAVLQCESNLTLLNLQNTNRWSPGSRSKGRWVNSSVSFAFANELKTLFGICGGAATRLACSISPPLETSCLLCQLTICFGPRLCKETAICAKNAGVVSSSGEVILPGTNKKPLTDSSLSHQQCHGNGYSWHLFFWHFNASRGQTY